MSVRRFRVPEGRTLYLPSDLTEGTGNTRLDSGQIVDLEAKRCTKYQRFLANRVKLGDLVELDVADAPAPGKE